MKKFRSFLFLMLCILLGTFLAACANSSSISPKLSIDTLEIIAEDQLGIAEGKYTVRYSVTDSYKSPISEYMKLGLTFNLTVNENLSGTDGVNVPVTNGSFIVEEGKKYTAKITATINGRSKNAIITVSGASVSENDAAVCNAGGLDVPMFFSEGGNFESFFDRISTLIQYFNLEGRVITENTLSVSIVGIGETAYPETEIDLDAPLNLNLGSYLATMKIGGAKYTNKIFNIYVGSEKIIGDYKYISTNIGAAIISYSGTQSPSLTVESIIGGSPVVAIGAYAFSENLFLQSVTIPASVKYIGESAFEGCANIDTLEIRACEKIGINAFKGLSSLITLSLGDSIIKLGSGSFAGCTALSSVEIGDGLITLPSGVFEGCTALKTLTLGSNIKNIGLYAFRACNSLTKAEIPGTVVVLSPRAFIDTASLAAYEVKGNSQNYVSENGIVYKKITVGSSKQYQIYMYPSGKTDRSYDSSGSKYVNDWISEVGEYAFLNNPYLASITFDNHMRALNRYSFYGLTALNNINLGGGVSELPYGVFSGCSSLTYFNVEKIDTVGDYAFENCTSLATVTFSEKLKSFGNNVFSGASALLSILIDLDNPYFSSEDGILYDKGKNTLLWYPFGKTNAKYNLPETVINIPAGVDFYKCKNLEELYITNTVPPTLATLNYDSARNLSIFVPKASLEVYSQANVWSQNATGLKNILYYFITSDEGIRPSGNWIARRTAYAYQKMLYDMKISTRGYTSTFSTSLVLTDEKNVTRFYELSGDFVFYPSTLTNFYLKFEFDEVFYSGEEETRVESGRDEIFHLYIAEGLEGSGTWFYLIDHNQKSCWEEADMNTQHAGKAWAHLIEIVSGGDISATSEGLSKLALLRAFQIHSQLTKYLNSDSIVTDVSKIESYIATFITNDMYTYSSENKQEEFFIDNVQLSRVVESAVSEINNTYNDLKNELFSDEQIYFSKNDESLDENLDYYDMILGSINIDQSCFGSVDLVLDNGSLSSFNIDIDNGNFTVTVDDPEIIGQTKKIRYIFSIDFTYSGRTIENAGDTLPRPDFPDFEEFDPGYINVNT